MHTLIKQSAIICILLGTIHFWAGLACSQDAEPESSLGFELSPVLQYRGVDGDEGKSREDHWVQDGWSGGLEHFLLEKSLKGDWGLRMEGRAIVPEEDYNFHLQLEKEDYGFFRAQYTEYRKYFDDTGGFFRPFSVPVFDLDKDMHLDIGNFLMEAGITIPDLPRIVVGYEHRFKEGKKSLIEWGSVSEGGLSRKIFPSFKEVDEEVDILRVEVEHNIGKVHVGDRFRYEKYKTETARFEEERDLDSATSEKVTVSEKYEHDALFNTLHLESHISEKIYFSLGYLLTDLEGDGAFSMLTVPFGPEPFDKNWRADSIDIDQESHVMNVNAQFGPYRHLSFYGGFQAEFTETEGDTDARLTEISFGGSAVSPEARMRSSMDKDGFMETVGVRYSGIPYTSLYAEGKWTQHGIDLLEREWEEGALAFERVTTDADRERYTLGFSTSPVRRLTLSARYKRSCRENVYNHKRDTEPGYSAFIDEQNLDTDEISAKATVRMTSAVKASFRYQLVKTEIDTWARTTPPSSVQSGDYAADIYSVSVTATPIPSMYLTGLFSCRDVNSESFDNESASVIEYDGDVYSFIGTAGWAVGEKTDLTLDYLYSWSDNFEDNSADGLPLGIDNDRHGLSLGFSRKMTEKVTLRFRYGFYKYEEDHIRGVDDYEAHLVGVAFAFQL